jgi:hypothetical protein
MVIHMSKVMTLAVLMSGMACFATNCSRSEPRLPSTGSGVPGPVWAAEASKIPDLFTGTWGGGGGGGAPGGRVGGPGGGPGGAGAFGGGVDVNSPAFVIATSFVEADPSRNVPFTPQAQKYVDAYVHKRDIPYAGESCTTPGPPISMRTGGIKFNYAPGLISIYQGSTGHTRFIKMDQPHGLTFPKYYGNSIGHWEGDTLVVESVDFLDDITFQYGVGKPLPPLETVGTTNLGPPPTALLAALSAAIWGPHGEGMRMVERMRLVDPETMEIKTTIYDDTVWTKPYEMSPRTYKRRAGGVPEEFICTASITSFDPATNTYSDKDPEEMVKLLDKQSR